MNLANKNTRPAWKFMHKGKHYSLEGHIHLDNLYLLFAPSMPVGTDLKIMIAVVHSFIKIDIQTYTAQSFAFIIFDCDYTFISCIKI